MSGSIFIGRITSEMNCGCTYVSRIRLCSSWRTVPGNLGEIFCGLYDMFSSGISHVSPCEGSGLSRPASIRMKVVLPMPFSPSSTMISESEKEPASTSSVKHVPFFGAISFLTMSGYSYAPARPDWWSSSVADSASLKFSSTSRKRMFSGPMKPARKMLIPSRTPKGIVTTP